MRVGLGWSHTRCSNPDAVSCPLQTRTFAGYWRSRYMETGAGARCVSHSISLRRHPE